MFRIVLRAAQLFTNRSYFSKQLLKAFVLRLETGSSGSCHTIQQKVEIMGADGARVHIGLETIEYKV